MNVSSYQPHSLAKLAATGLLAVSLGIAGCKSAPPAPAANTPPKVAQQGTLNPDGTFTPNAVQPGQQGTMNPDGTFTPNATQQSASSIPPPPPASMTPAPATVPAPAPMGSVAPAPPPAPVYRTVPAGTSVAVTITQSLSASHNEVGDGFSGVLAQPLAASGGRTVFARGTAVKGTVVAAKGKGRFKGAGALGIELTSIGGERVSTSEYEKEGKGRGKRSAGFIGGGGGVGALIGGVAGGGKGALIGGRGRRLIPATATS